MPTRIISMATYPCIREINRNAALNIARRGRTVEGMAWFTRHFPDARAIAVDPALVGGAAVAAVDVRDIVLAVPRIAQCSVCGSQCTEKLFDATVFTIVYAQPVRLQTWRCTNPTCTFVAPWDGREFGIINAYNVALLAFELALEYLELFCGSGASVASWSAAKVTQYMSVNDAQPDEATKLAKTWTGLRSRMPSWIATFVYLMQIDADIFDCVYLADKLDMVAGDGILLSIAASRLKTLKQPWSADPDRLAAANRVLELCLDENATKIVRLLAVIVADAHDLIPMSRLKPFVDSIHCSKTYTPLGNLTPM
ncbi:hypothetical protein GGF32_007688, partial [Allomyces javanicus]